MHTDEQIRLIGDACVEQGDLALSALSYPEKLRYSELTSKVYVSQEEYDSLLTLLKGFSPEAEDSFCGQS